MRYNNKRILEATESINGGWSWDTRVYLLKVIEELRDDRKELTEDIESKTLAIEGYIQRLLDQEDEIERINNEWREENNEGGELKEQRDELARLAFDYFHSTRPGYNEGKLLDQLYEKAKAILDLKENK